MCGIERCKYYTIVSDVALRSLACRFRIRYRYDVGCVHKTGYHTRYLFGERIPLHRKLLNSTTGKCNIRPTIIMQNYQYQLLFIFVTYLLLTKTISFVYPAPDRRCSYRIVSTPVVSSRISSLRAVKLVYKWRILPSGSLTGISDEGIITTSELQRPETAAPNAVVVTSSGSQYKLVGKPVQGSVVQAAASSPNKETQDALVTENGTSAAASVALFAGFGIFILVLIQKSGILASSAILESGSFANIRFVALLVYCVGVLVATIQLIDDALKFSKK